jgi:hypothetical protein
MGNFSFYFTKPSQYITVSGQQNVKHFFRPVVRMDAEAKSSSGEEGQNPMTVNCHLSFVIYHWSFDDLKLAGFNDKWQMTNQK